MTEIGTFTEEKRIIGKRGRVKGSLGGIASKYKREKLRTLRKELSELTETEARDIKRAQIKELQGRKLTIKDQRKLNWFNKNIRPIVESFIKGKGQTGRKLNEKSELIFREMIDNLTTGSQGPVKKQDIEILTYGIEGMLKKGFSAITKQGKGIDRERMLQAFHKLSIRNTDPVRRQEINNMRDNIRKSTKNNILKMKLLSLFSATLTKAQKVGLSPRDITRIFNEKTATLEGRKQIARELVLENRVIEKNVNNPTKKGRQKEDKKYFEKVLMGRQMGFRDKITKYTKGRGINAKQVGTKSGKSFLIRDVDLTRKREGEGSTIRARSVPTPAKNRTRERLEKDINDKMKEEFGKDFKGNEKK